MGVKRARETYGITIGCTLAPFSCAYGKVQCVRSWGVRRGGRYANVVVAQFEKVTRTKNRWKCTLKDGVMHLNGRDFLFTRASGEMQF